MISRRLALALLAASPALPTLAQPSTGPAGPGLFETGAPTHAITRHAFVSIDGLRRYRVDLAAPKAKPSKSGWPSLCLLDGNAAFTQLTSANLATVPGLALIAIGYETDRRFDDVARTFDYTPPGKGPPERAERPEGGSEAFRRLLLEQIRPALAKTARLDPARAALWGHSYGALFVLHTLRRQPDAFSTYIPVSPSLWWRQGAIAAAPFPSPRRRTRIALMIGDREARRASPGDAPDPDAAATAVARIKVLTERLAITPRLDATLTVLPGQTHGGALTTSLPLALRLAAEETQ